MEENRTSNQALAKGGAGGGLAVIVVILLPKLTTIVWSPEETVLMMGALGAVFTWIVHLLTPAKERSNDEP